MPSKTPKQRRLMAAAAHTKGGFGGVPQKVGKEFNQADQAKGFSKGGSVTQSGNKHDPSIQQQFENNIAETAANPRGWRRF